MMTRKHFDAIARGLRESHPENTIMSRKVTSYKRSQWRTSVDSVAYAIASVSPTFDRARFLAACEVQS